MKIKYSLPLLFLIFLGIIAHLSIWLPYGISYCLNDMCGVWLADIYRARDETWHMALASTAFSTIPFSMPLFAGQMLIGYHFLYGFFLHIITSLGIPVLFANYTLFPLAWIVTYIAASYVLAKKINPSSKFLFSFLFFQLFAGSFGYVFALYHFGNIFGGAGMNYHSLTYSTNMPLAWSLVTFLLILSYIYKKEWQRKDYLIVFLLLFLTWGFKFYGAVAVCIVLMTYWFFLFIQKKVALKEYAVKCSLLLSISFVAIILFYNPFQSKAGNVFQFSPFATVHSVIEEKTQFYLNGIANLRYILQAQGWGPKLLLIELLTTALAFFFTIGTRSIAFISIAIDVFKRRFEKRDISLIAVFTLTFVLSIMLVQRGDWFNPMQFFVYGMIILNIYAAKILAALFEKKNIMSYVLAVFVLLLTIPHAINTIYGYTYHLLPFTPPKVFTYTQQPVFISDQEIAALTALKKQPKGVVFQLPYIPPKKFVIYTILPFWNANDSAYIPALSGKQSYMADIHQLELFGVNTKEREKQAANTQKTGLDNIPVQYFYLHKNHPYYKNVMKKTKKDNYIEIFNNSEILVLKKK